ncbi:hypothetical protein MOMA_02245 [Moraxella macacae 0408225]|uniref:Uncharacterized protein n=1 Tax=Moraxella macacae 0408225 TaxID=1230338 RepID=L2F9P5_9GAMM|nr:hypothetical protein [Moraxella macacae]ELA09188.1 hypothetical protein MOMA_02245 [Moraxella macacae 0408225]
MDVLATKQVHKFPCVLCIATGLICFGISQTSIADTTKAINWLKNNTKSYIASELQTKQEIGFALAKPQKNLTQIQQQIQQEQSTEGLTRLILLSYSQNQTADANTAWQKLLTNQNQDGGFAHLQDWQSNPLDTAYVLIVLDKTNYLNTLDDKTWQQWQTVIAKALQYLASQ